MSSPSWAATPRILRIAASGPGDEPLALDPARLATGSPDPGQCVHNVYADSGGRFFAGRWSSGVGAWRVSYTEHELCVITEGRIRLTGADGDCQEFGPGDCFVVPAGYQGLWEVLVPAAKFYAIYEPPPA
jgi:uncharacterized cupin superfamily protein